MKAHRVIDKNWSQLVDKSNVFMNNLSQGNSIISALKKSMKCYWDKISSPQSH